MDPSQHTIPLRLTSSSLTFGASSGETVTVGYKNGFRDWYGDDKAVCKLSQDPWEADEVEVIEGIMRREVEFDLMENQVVTDLKTGSHTSVLEKKAQNQVVETYSNPQFGFLWERVRYAV